MVEVLECACIRKTVSPTENDVIVYWQIAPSGEEAAYIILQADFCTTIVGTKDIDALQTTMLLFPGDILLAKTFDASTGGTCRFRLSYKLTELDI